MKSLNHMSTDARRALEFNSSDYVNAKVLVANTAQTETVPAAATVVCFSATGNFYVNWSTTAAVPAVSVTDGTSAELNPSTRRVVGGSTFSIIAPAATVVTIVYYN